MDWAYDQMRREHADEAAWAEFLAEQGMDPQSFRAELRAQHTVAALLDQEVREAEKGDEGRVQSTRAEIEKRSSPGCARGRGSSSSFDPAYRFEGVARTEPSGRSSTATTRLRPPSFAA